ncbi:retropepsin-like aspartic protease family protein [Palleronia pelagia]|uniref:Aspartyl protease family protein n=1 Tax=Palleronia pelagia TaxID=387096 RepID=A0A1H8B0F4_9RHOB|nr:TIGR02281 family clan AA aspartic protease [Palleronia pelagia]SEM76452.1 aspartyl protease family protein [Palleronia pelagia]
MNGDSIASLVYLVLLGSVIAGYFFVSNRNSLGKTMQQAAIWGLIFVGAIAVAGLWSDLRDDVAPAQVLSSRGELVVPRSFDGHYRVTLNIQDISVDFIVDTGASDMVLSQRDARRVGLDPEQLAYTGRARTANGTVPMAFVMLSEVSVGEFVAEDVRASVNGGEMSSSLLGMSYLQRFGRISIENDRLTLSP